MKGNALLRARLAGILVAAALLASCYAPLANQEGYLNLSIRAGGPPFVVDPEVIVMVVDSAYQATLAETLSLIGKAHVNGGLSGSDQNRLTTLAEQLATSGLLKFGGYPFYRIDIIGPSGSFKIPGVPAGRSYFVKLFVFNPGFTFDVKKIDQNFYTLVQSENLVFTTETYNPALPLAWQTWAPNTPEGQPTTVNSGGTAAFSVTLGGVP
ncbi:MAG: hypothetical protein ABSG63_08500 [Spirochaetia bacterium]